MKKRPSRSNQKPGRLAILLAALLLAACSPAPSPTPFLAPKSAPPTGPVLAGQQPIIPTFTPPPEPTPSPTPAPPCANGLTFLQDLTVPDDTVVSAGSNIDKQWLVQNSGSCNWDTHYRLKFSGGDPLGASEEQALYPARAGTQAVIRITFTAPVEPGTYKSSWQAIGSDGLSFGDPLYIEIVVNQ